MCEPAARHEDGYPGIRRRVEAGRSESDAVHHAVRPGQTWQIRQSEFAGILGMDGTTLTRNLQPLLKNEWIQIDREEDQRVRLISITKPGRQVLDEAVPLWRQVQSQFVMGLGDEQWSGFLGTLAVAVDIAQRD